jgi:hypothetical protein
MSVENKSVGINSETHEVIKYCVECERKCPKSCGFALSVKKVRFNFILILILILNLPIILFNR